VNRPDRIGKDQGPVCCVNLPVRASFAVTKLKKIRFSLSTIIKSGGKTPQTAKGSPRKWRRLPLFLFARVCPGGV